MCGRYNVVDSWELRQLMGQLGLADRLPTPQLNVPPGGIGEFVIEAGGARYLLSGIWSLVNRAAVRWARLPTQFEISHLQCPK